MNLSIFAKVPYFSRNRLKLGSSLIRGEQMATYLGAKYNPTRGYKNGVCIWVKPDLGAYEVFYKKIKGKAYLDIVDYIQYIEWMKCNPDSFGIVASQYSYDVLKKEMPGRFTFIPQQHCNFNNLKRTRKEIVNVGIISSPRNIHYSLEDLNKRLENIGLKLITNFNFHTREDVVNFYKNIDIQIVWYLRKKFFKNPLSIINAASFGIPTVAAPHRGYKEVEDYYIHATSVDQLIDEVEKLKDSQNYMLATKNLFKMSKKYHISRIAKKYKKLLKK